MCPFPIHPPAFLAADNTVFNSVIIIFLPKHIHTCVHMHEHLNNIF